MVDMTQGNSNKLMIKFALPMILGNIFQQAYNLVDSIVVGKFVGAEALAAVGASFAVVTFITSIIIGLAMGVGVMLAQFYGSREIEKFTETTFVALIFIGSVTLIIMILTLVGMDKLLEIFNMPEELISGSKAYLVIIIIGLPFTFIYNLATALLRAIGDSKRPLYFLVIAAVVNIFLDLLLVLKFHLGIRGVAVATLVAQSISALFAGVYVCKKLSFIKFKEMRLTFHKALWKQVVKYSVLTSMQQSIMNFGILIVQGLVNSFGSIVMAAFAAGVKIDSLAYMPVQDFGNAFATFVAQNKGAGKSDRIQEGVRGAVKIIILFCIIVSSLIFIFSENIIGFFISSGEKEVIHLGVEYLSVVSIFYVFIGFLFMFYGLFRGVGLLKVSIILTVISLGTRVLLAYLLSATALGASGIWWSIPIGWILADLVGFIYYHKKIITIGELEKELSL